MLINVKSGFFIFGLFFFWLFLPIFTSASVVINEIAWMGTVGNQYGEWIELYNNGNDEIDLNNWKLYKEKDGSNILIFTLTKKITSVGYLIIERTTDSSPDPLPNINDESGKFGGGSLVNLPGGEHLILKNAEDNIIEDLDFSTDGWPAGDNTTKQTMQLSSSGWITATATPKAVNFTPSEEPPADQQQTQTQSQSSSSGSSSSPYIPPEKLPKIKADAGPDKTVVVGANVEFRGQAFGLEDELLDNARYLWTFGDGAAKDGKNITHIYQYSGEYIVALNVSSGEYSASDYMLVKALPNQVFISEVKTDPSTSLGASWIELENKSKQEIDISGCQIKYNNQTFIFPQSTRIRPNAYLVIPSSISGMVFNPGKGIVEFLYSGGFKADVFNYDGILKSGQSFNRDGASSLILSETPGGKNSSNVNNSSTANKNPLPNTKEQKTEEQKTASENLSEKGIEEQNNKINPDANAGAINLTSSNSNSKTYFIIAILGVIIFGAAAIFFVRRQRGV